MNNSYGYNDNDDQTLRTIGSTTYALSYDGDDQLTAITTGSGASLTTTAAYTYDAGGRRMSRSDGTTTTGFVYDGSRGTVVNEVQSGSVSATYTYGNALIGKGSDVNLYDGVGSSRQTTSSGGSVTASAIYEGFGQTVASSGGGTATYGYCATSGYQSDGYAGLTHVGARYYDESVGRFITRDTQLDQKPYNYCEADPVNLVDPSGHNVPVGATVGAIIGAVVIGGIAVDFGLGAPGAIAGTLIGAVGGGGIGGVIGGRSTNNPDAKTDWNEGISIGAGLWIAAMATAFKLL